MRTIALAALLWLAAPAVAHGPAGHSHDEADRAAAMGAAASALLATLSPDQRTAAVRPLDDAAARTSWHFLPLGQAPRQGVEVAGLDATQRKALHRLLSVALSSQGYLKTTGIMWLDDVLRQLESEALATAAPGPITDLRRQVLPQRRSDAYVLLMLGDPASPRWGFILSGHHMALNLSVVDGRIAFMPAFLGASPQEVPSGPQAGRLSLQHEMDRAAALIASLTPAQRAAALQSPTVPKSLLFARKAPTAADLATGAAVATLDARQRELVMALVREYVGNAADEPAARKLAAISADRALRFAWWGPVDDLRHRFMYRLAGPSILIEFVREPTPDGGPANHVHAIVRDPANDYGGDWLGRHYVEDHTP
jgi:hypothetical protein